MDRANTIGGSALDRNGLRETDFKIKAAKKRNDRFSSVVENDAVFRL